MLTLSRLRGGAKIDDGNPNPVLREPEGKSVVSHPICQLNIDNNLKRGLPVCVPLKPRDKKLAIVGSAPSVIMNIYALREWDGEIWAINGAYDYLLDNGIVPQGFIGLDPLPALADYVTRARPETVFYMGGIVDPCVLDRLKDRTVALWFHEQDGLKFPKGLWVVDGGSTAVTRAPFLADMLGFKDITIFGADCSVAQHSRYCYGRKYKEDSVAPLITVMVNGEGPFRADVKMLEQAAELGIIKDLFDRDGKKLDFCCFGLINAYLRSPILEAA